ncbi:MAG: metalloregulator ArsR/SmtB family transcription factor [Nitrospirales bacterium]|nr:metalloregulator ArsR/SmtB family transcription factor [Nitrospirales bacterium]
MQKITELFKILSDESRVRILMLLHEKELCVCQMVAVLGLSQPLISRNLSLLAKAGFLDARREGKLMFYKKKKALARRNSLILSFLKETAETDKIILKDISSLRECEEYQRMVGKCDMDTLKAYMEYKKNKGGRHA